MRDSLFGNIITVNHRLVRQADYSTSPVSKKWVTLEIPPTKVMLIGYRHLTNGAMAWHGTDLDGCYNYLPTETVPAMLVVENMRRKPFYVRRAE